MTEIRIVDRAHVSLWIVLVATLALAACTPAGQLSRSPMGGVLVLDHRWQAELAPRDDFWDSVDYELGTPRLVSSNLIVVGTSTSELIAVRVGDGQVVWQVEGPEDFVAPVVQTGDQLIIGAVNGEVVSLDARSGRELWRFDAGAPVEGPVATGDGRVYITNSLNRIFAADLESGEEIWRQERDKVNDFTMFGHSGPLLIGEQVIAGFSDGQVMAYNAVDGSVVWGRDLSKGRARFRDIDAQPFYYEGALYVASFIGGLYKLDALTGDILWHREVEGARGIQAYDGVLYFTSRDGIHAADFTTGADIWLHPLDVSILATEPAVGRGFVYVGLQREGLLVINRIDGSQVTLMDTGSGITGKPLLLEGYLAILSNGGILHMWNAVDGPIVDHGSRTSLEESAHFDAPSETGRR